MTRLLLILTLIPLCGEPCYGQTYDNGAVHNFHPEISYDHFRFEPFIFNPLVIVYATGAECSPRYNMDWHRYGHPIARRVWILTCDYWIPYPISWGLTDNDIARCIAAYSLTFDGVPLWFRYDFNGDGFCDLSDLTFMGLAMSRGDEDLQGFTFMGEIYNTRRAR